MAERQGLKVYGERRTLVMLALGFAAGLPNLLVFDTLSAWLRDEGVSLAVIGFFSLATLAYSAKFLWAPLVDRFDVPGLTARLGHRRSWMLAAQVAVMLGLGLIAGGDPGADLARTAAFAVFVGFAGATQDIVIDAWRIEAADDSRQGALAAAYQWGYRIAGLVAGGAALALAEAAGWNLSYFAMGGLMLVGMAGVLCAPRETARPAPLPRAGGAVPARPGRDAAEWLVRALVLLGAALIVGAGLSGNPFTLTVLTFSDDALGLAPLWTRAPGAAYLQFGAVILGLGLILLACWPLPGRATRPGQALQRAFGAPLGAFFGEFGRLAGPILALICVYRLSDFVLNIMNPFYLDLGFSKTEVAEVRKVFGMVMTMGGVFLGGWAVARLGVLRALMIGAFAGPASNLVYAWLAVQGPWLPALFIAIGVDNLASGYAGTCLIAYMSGLTSAGFTATQYALFSSLYALPGKLIASQSGRIVEGAARAAEAGGLPALLLPLFERLPVPAFAEGAAKAGTSAAALGAGYVTFFLYSVAIGLVAIVLCLVVTARQGQRRPGPDAGRAV
ncbi:AmpG family muropeptide MFS transporter [Zavarzinia compransoris]|uniref:Permease n=1 Tax=Zavarzinia compransoris TaxID=1264899 RepID=A0A317DVX2_9PROT|nr:MFS transporter [Zavarzinia compransoris]PWR18838.1 permease [Zavarzinia compransoris]TDP48828.1 PAT family beta-lactamase induction signal transducer AmpG [Zavarzinia compransoris]